GTQEWADAVEQLLLDPLGMTATSARMDGLDASPDTTRGHQRVGDELRVLEPARFPAGVAGAGALVSNLTDMARWVQLHLNRGHADGVVVSEQTLEETYRPRVPITGDFAEGMMHGDGPPRISYATGWLVHALAEGRIIEH